MRAIINISINTQDDLESILTILKNNDISIEIDIKQEDQLSEQKRYLRFKGELTKLELSPRSYNRLTLAYKDKRFIKEDFALYTEQYKNHPFLKDYQHSLSFDEWIDYILGFDWSSKIELQKHPLAMIKQLGLKSVEEILIAANEYKNGNKIGQL